MLLIARIVPRSKCSPFGDIIALKYQMIKAIAHMFSLNTNSIKAVSFTAKQVKET